ncbi:hypothetical protein TWF102_007184 [Orbilia oligospora]|uniref:Uncharacterized protein n=1 Tax=Orbilia oligospora TaxID=2813651 RepID=A0A7C8JDM3_ORBOL|nr:hypothetical protein TWF102_007184 [Orbilia oligospora]KAF3102870.1 hypothetical protein TWF103_007571 [Orbilia oligospora]
MQTLIMSLSLLTLGIAPTALAGSDKLCVEVANEFMPGECSVKVIWNRLTDATVGDTPLDFPPPFNYSIQGTFFDANGRVISDQSTLGDCSNVHAKEQSDCRFGSKVFPYKMKVAPGAGTGGDFLQFNYGDLEWHTNPNPSDGRKFVGDKAKGDGPWCNLKTDWTKWSGEMETDGESFVLPSTYDKTKDQKVETREVECSFACDVFVVDARPGKGSFKKCSEKNTNPVDCPLPISIPVPGPPMPVPIPIPCIPVPCAPPLVVPPVPPLPPIANGTITGTLPNLPPPPTTMPVRAKTTIETRTRTTSLDDGQGQ